MKKILFFSFLAFAAGIGLTFMVVVNPLDSHWIHSIQEKLGVGHQAPASETTQGQLWTCGMHPELILEEPGDCPICRMALVPIKGFQKADKTTTSAGERKIKHWRAPMDPTFISDQPGKSTMGMDLVPVYEEEAGEAPPGTVQIDPVFVQNIGVQSVEVERTDIPFSIRTIGHLTYNDEQIHWITTKYDGWIEEVYVNYVGQSVKKGQKLFEIYSPDLVTTQQEYLDAVAYAHRLSQSHYPDIAERARSLLESSRQRLRYWDITDEQIGELEKAGQVRRTLTVVSKASGLVVEKMNQAIKGMYVKPGMNLYKIVDLSTIWVEAEVFEHQIPWLKPGQKASVEIPSQPGRTLTGTVRYIYPFFNQTTRTLKVSLELPNPGWKLRADMYANVVFEVPSARGVLAVPEEAVIHSGKRNVIVLDRGNGTFQVKEVILGVNGQGLWEVLEGIHEGDRVVVSSQFLINSESNLREAIRKMVSRQHSEEDPSAPPAPTHQP
jgi:Cu(I)/Ag(I) efflux system membrane fusion protein/cobalt-zinc-cadmium efflux system membrane fusion protein